MKSIIGRKLAWNTTPDNPYVVHAIGVKEECGRVPTWCSSADQCWNLFMNELLAQIKDNKDKNIIWRRFPEVSEHKFKDELDEPLTLWKITARYCFE
jgi:hypothetical protein